MSGVRGKLPSWAQLLAWLGIISTILGIIGFFVGDLGLGNRSKGLTEEQIIATLSALQEGKQQAELQLTQIALNNLSAANQQTQSAFEIERLNIQATVNAFQAEQQVFVATQNALAAATATAEAAIAQQNAFATQQALDAAATAAFLANITPTPTDMPTATPVPAPVADYRSLVAALVERAPAQQIAFTVQTAQPLPETPPEGLAYVFSLDVDGDPATGLALNDIGVDRRVSIRYTSGGWGGVVRSVADDGALGEPFAFTDITIDGGLVQAVLDPAAVSLPDAFDWVVRAELGGETYSLLPETGHLSYDGK